MEITLTQTVMWSQCMSYPNTLQMARVIWKTHHDLNKSLVANTNDTMHYIVPSERFLCLLRYSQRISWERPVALHLPEYGRSYHFSATPVHVGEIRQKGSNSTTPGMATLCRCDKNRLQCIWTVCAKHWKLKTATTHQNSRSCTHRILRRLLSGKQHIKNCHSHWNVTSVCHSQELYSKHAKRHWEVR